MLNLLLQIFFLVILQSRGSASAHCNFYDIEDNTITIKCSKVEKEALLSVREELIDHFGVLSSWGAGDCCKWQGVRCDNTTGHVIELDVSGISVSDFGGPKGKLSSSLVRLQYLNHLDLSLNNFHQEFPGVIGSLRKLEYLNLSYSKWEGASISPDFRKLTKLQVLDLESSDITLENLDLLSHLYSIRYLNLNSVNLSTANDWWVQTISKLPLLEELHLSNCTLPSILVPSSLNTSNYSRYLSVVDLSSNINLLPSSIYPWLFNFSGSLTHIDLSHNNLPTSLPLEFGNMVRLSHLFMDSSRLVGEIPRSLGNLSNLVELKLAYNSLTGSIFTLMKDFSKNSGESLRYLDMAVNCFTGPLVMQGFPSLKKLTLQWNQLDQLLLEGVFPNLQELDLTGNRLSGSVPDQLASHFPSLRYLSLESNEFNGTLPESISNISKLEYFFIGSNHLEGVITESHMLGLSALREIILSFNKNLAIKFSLTWIPPFQLDVISLCEVKQGPHFPKWLQNQHNFSVLDISNSGIVDKIPVWFWDLSSSLKELNLSNNKIHGVLPDISPFKFAVLDFSSNNLSGPLPILPPDVLTLDFSRNRFQGTTSVLCETNSLTYLDLSNNLLSGNLPNCSDGFSTLNVLILGNNNFSGSIPESFGSIVDIRILNIRDNILDGEIPGSLKNWKNVQVCDLGGNKLSGKLPEWIGMEWKGLIFLSLGFNTFSGKIPSSFCDLGNIKILDISRNKISGTVPKCFNKLDEMTTDTNFASTITSSYPYTSGGMSKVYILSASIMWKGIQSKFRNILGLVRCIDLSSNNLSGRIPLEITTLKGLIGLNLSRNYLSGTIPPNISLLSSLDFLDLSSNSISGIIPFSLSQLDSLGYLDLSYNNLSGKIPTSTSNKLQTFNASSYVGNSGLCGSPLPNGCPGDVIPGVPLFDHQDIAQDELFTSGFYASLAFGFVIGFGGICGSLLLNKSWRNVYFKFLNEMYDKLYVTLAVKKAQLLRCCLN
ncbi:hypothetical protein Leryth_016537 [Lithospermum erythrorhizon]|nr:hypothetical protein Leryth_016537 [Lithospermum erythrorhizon]